MIPILYTNTDAIRAALGLTEKELTDQFVADLEVVDMLKIELRSVYPAHVVLFNLITVGSPTSSDLDTWEVLRQYAKYEAACYLLPQFQMLVTQKISDGDAEVTRFQSNNLNETIERLKAMRDLYRNMLVNPDSLTLDNFLSHVAMVQPNYDPVTNI